MDISLLAKVMNEFQTSVCFCGASAELASGYFKKVNDIAALVAEQSGTPLVVVDARNYQYTRRLLGHIPKDFIFDEIYDRKVSELEQWLQGRLW